MKRMNWNRKVSLLALGLGVAALVASTHARAATSAPGEFVVRLAKGASEKNLSAKLTAMGMTLGESLLTDDQGSLYVVRATGMQVMNADFQANAINRLSNVSGVEFAEPNYVYSIVGQAETLPEGARFGELWGMNNVGQKDSKGNDGVVDADIDAPEAWDIATGSKDIVVAVVDTGVSYEHADLKANMWSMPGRPEVHGFNAVSSSRKYEPMDDHGHGSHCSGTVGGVGAQGVFGVNHVASIMAVKILNSAGGGSLDGIIKGVKFAADNGARVISASWGGVGDSQALFDAVKYARSKGVLFVAAAGNGDSKGVGQNNDQAAIYPASYSTKLDNVMAIAASDNRDEMATFSNFGPLSVHLMAPGVRILSSVLNGEYAVYSGTSMATPHVAGAATLLLSKEPGLSYLQVKERIVSTADKVPAAQGKTISGGRLNVFRMLANQ